MVAVVQLRHQRGSNLLLAEWNLHLELFQCVTARLRVFTAKMRHQFFNVTTKHLNHLPEPPVRPYKNVAYPTPCTSSPTVAVRRRAIPTTP